MPAVKWFGSMFAGVALFAGLSFWLVAGVTYEAWKDSHRVPTRMHPARLFSESLSIILFTGTVSLALHGVAWLARSSMTRRQQSMGMSASFWSVLYTTAYLLGFIGGFAIYLTAPV